MEKNTIKLATWNLLWGDYDYKARFEEAAEHLREADIVCLQEVREDNSYHIGIELAKYLNLKVSANVFFSDQSFDTSTSETIRTYLAILSKYETLESGLSELGSGEYGVVAYSILNTEHRPTLVITAHLQWGGEQEYNRLVQAELINNFARKKEAEMIKKYNTNPITILAGDLNTEPTAQTINYLAGKYARNLEDQTYWVDAWSFANPGDEGYTSVPAENQIAYKVGLSHVLEPNMIPARRIDYVFIKGWTYGKPGHALAAKLLGTRSLLGETLASDHYGILVDLWNPASPTPSDD
jgi:endonuclease/exonuclease/phosphatase family metal-dependent hydrolase